MKECAVRISLGYDTSSTKVGWAVVRSDGELLEHVASGTISLNKKASHAARMVDLYEDIVKHLGRYSPNLLTVEEMSSIRNAKVVKILQGYIAVVMLAGMQICRLEANVLTPQTVKARVGINPMSPQEKKKHTSKDIRRIYKAKVIALVNARFDLDLGEDEEDRADAIAIALAGLGG